MAKDTVKKGGSKGSDRATAKRAASGRWASDGKKRQSKKGGGTINPGPGKNNK